MSLILFLFYWIVIPGLIIAAGVWLWQRTATAIAKRSVVAISALVMSWFIWVAVGEMWWVDRQVKELCAKDGGVTIYETVRLSPEKYDALRQVNFIVTPEYLLKSTDEYYSKSEHLTLQENNPKVLRNHYQIIRRSDDKILGEYISYGRSGGGLPGPWHGSSLLCPDPTKVKFATAIFFKGDEE